MRNEVATYHGGFIPKTASDKLNNAIVRIQTNKGQGTGFFLRFKIKDQPFFSLWTNFHVIPENMVKSKNTIKIYYGPKDNEEEKSIKLNRNKRFIVCYNEPKDITVIQILEKDKIAKDKYLYPELNYKNEGFKIYANNDLYSMGYPSVDIGMGQYEGESCESSGKIKKIFNNFEFKHTLDSRPGCSGMPICLIYNKYVVGIHKNGNKKKNINEGTFIGVVIDELEKGTITTLPPCFNQRNQSNYNKMNNIINNDKNINNNIFYSNNSNSKDSINIKSNDDDDNYFSNHSSNSISNISNDNDKRSINTKSNDNDNNFSNHSSNNISNISNDNDFNKDSINTKSNNIDIMDYTFKNISNDNNNIINHSINNISNISNDNVSNINKYSINKKSNVNNNIRIIIKLILLDIINS